MWHHSNFWLNQKIKYFVFLLSPGEKFNVKEVEYVLPIHNLDEDLSRKHLRAFQKLEELGFDRMATHNALMNTKLDHDKALEILLK